MAKTFTANAIINIIKNAIASFLWTLIFSKGAPPVMSQRFKPVLTLCFSHGLREKWLQAIPTQEEPESQVFCKEQF